MDAHGSQSLFAKDGPSHWRRGHRRTRRSRARRLRDDDDGGDADPTASISQPTTDTSARPKRGGLYRWAWQGTPHLYIHQDSIAGATAIITATYNRVMRFEDQAQLPARKSPCLSGGGSTGLECCRHNSADTLSAY
ncbi:MAG: hypothetical protein ACSLFM_04525 [Tepidiformaceae bacterium]